MTIRSFLSESYSGGHASCAELFNKQVPLQFLSKNGHLNRKNVRTAIRRTSTGTNNMSLANSSFGPRSVSPNSLLISLTDEDDPFFLFEITLDAGKFSQLKQQQNLLVEFMDFSNSLTQLLEECIKSSQMDGKFLARLSHDGEFSIMETNSFRQISHLTLVFTPASEEEMKSRMMEMILAAKTESDSLMLTISEKERIIERQARDYETLKSEFHDLKSGITSREISLQDEHQRALEKAQREWAAEKQDLIENLEAGKRSCVAEASIKADTLQDQINSLQSEYNALDSAYASMKDEFKLSNESLESTKLECTKLHHEIDLLQKEKHTLLDSKENLCHELDLSKKSYNELEREFVEYRSKMTSFESKMNDISRLEGRIDSLNQEVDKERKDAADSRSEVSKANEIIIKLQAELKSHRSKLKLKNIVAVQQEKLLDEKETSLSSLTKENASLNESIADKDKLLSNLRKELEALKQQLIDSKRVITENNDVIEWLHKQLNAGVMHRSIGALGQGRNDVIAKNQGVLRNSQRMNQPHDFRKTSSSLSNFNSAKLYNDISSNETVLRASQNLLDQLPPQKELHDGPKKPIEYIPPKSNYF